MADPSKKTGLSLYAHLLGGDNATISSAPVSYDQSKADQDAAAAQKKKDASLNFQPIKRPQVKAKPKVPSSVTSSSAHKFSSSTTTASTLPQGPSSTPSVQRSNFDDWVGDEDDEYYYQDRKQNNKKNKKKKKQQQQQQQQKDTQTWDWDDIYDPTRPNTYADYRGSDEQYREHRDWKARLYYYQLKDAKKAKQSEEQERKSTNSMFAPPTNLNFAPPSFDAPTRSQPVHVDDDDDYRLPEPPTGGAPSERRAFAPPSFAPPAMLDQATDEDSDLRRMRMSGMAPAPSPSKQASPPAQASPPPAPPVIQLPDLDKAAKIADAQAKIAAFKAKMVKPPTPARDAKQDEPCPPPPPSAEQQIPPPPPPLGSSGTISRAPVRYEVPPPDLPADDDATSGNGNDPSEDQPRSKKPGQKGFAERLMSKYGWEKGQGLGASGDGITTALIGKAEKSKKRSDPDGGRLPAVTLGKIVGGKRRKIEGSGDDDGRFGKMSDVVKLEGMLDGLDVQREIEDNNLMQEVGEEMGEKYGNVERVFVWREEMGGKGEVFVKFTSQLSALRAVNAMDETTFAGNAVAARFFDGDKFEAGEYGG